MRRPNTPLLGTSLTRRPRRAIVGTHIMEVSLQANACTQETEKVSVLLCRHFDRIEEKLSGDYGGTMEHLWIDFELIPRGTGPRQPWSFRFQRKVGGGRCHLTGLPTERYENVGHYSVIPDFRVLARLPLKSVVNYALSLIYASTIVLIDKEKKLGGLDANGFRANFLSVCKQLGYSVTTEERCQPHLGPYSHPARTRSEKRSR